MTAFVNMLEIPRFLFCFFESKVIGFFLSEDTEKALMSERVPNRVALEISSFNVLNSCV